MKNIKVSKLSFTLIAFVIIVLISLQLLNGLKIKNNQVPRKSTNKQVSYTSKSLGVFFTAPEIAKISENINTITIDINDEVIIISRSASYYDNVQEHVAYLEELNNYTFDKKEKVNENILMTQLGDKTMYFQKIGDYVFSISTDYTDLYEDLESISYSLK